MSRSYRVSVRESVNRVITAEDSVCTELEIIEVLPPERMAELLANELKGRGFERNGDLMTRKEKNGISVEVNVKTSEITVRVTGSEKTTLEGEKTGRAWDDVGPHANQVQEELRKQLQKELDLKAQGKTQELQSKITDKLEGHLNDLRQELDQVANRVTAEALKEKARSMGQIKEMSEDQQTGELTIVVEV